MATASTGRFVASATAAIHAVTRDPPPLATMRVAFTPERSSMRRTTKPLASYAARSSASAPEPMSSP